MKQFNKQTIFVASVVVALLATSVIVGASAFDRAATLRAKAEAVKQGVQNLAKAGEDPSQPLQLLQQAKAAFDRGNPDEGESFLNAALKLLGNDAKARKSSHEPMPFFSSSGKVSKLYGSPEEVFIEGYREDCMEPLISRDGKFIFYNNSNAENVQTHIRLAKRIDRNHFTDIGLLPGAQSDSKDMAPTMDNQGNFIFTSVRSFPKDGKSLYTGSFSAESLHSVSVLKGEIWPKLPGWIDMDCGITPDGKALVISRAFFNGSVNFPVRSDLIWCDLINGQWVINPHSEQILAKVNTDALEYAPSIDDNGLELYFTRSGLVHAAHGRDVQSKIMVAHRKSTANAFDEPEELSDLTGFIEAPTLSSDLSEIFFHKKKGDRFVLCRAVRNPMRQAR